MCAKSHVISGFWLSSGSLEIAQSVARLGSHKRRVVSCS